MLRTLWGEIPGVGAIVAQATVLVARLLRDKNGVRKSFSNCSYKKGVGGVGDGNYFSFAYSAFAVASSGRSGSASFHVARKS
jgi:hypothetical protein